MAEARMGVAVPAAGSGRRMGGQKKAFLELAGEPLLVHCLRPFLRHPGVVAVTVALPADEARTPPSWLTELDPRVGVVAGGETRLESVQRAVEALGDAVEVICVHDGARPLVTAEVIQRCVRVARGGEGAVAGWPVTDTLKEVDGERRILATPDRSSLWRAQTPQVFPAGALRRAYRSALAEGVEATDDAAVFTWAGGRVRMVEGDPWNLKVTYPDDVAVAELLLNRVAMRGESTQTAKGGAT
jgi:2-C-methyl-D-erythritol 4-phosphate cytidylyltransferase